MVDSGGARIHYQVFGNGPQAILLLPTWSIVHSDFWRHQVPHLARHYTVVAFDGRGNGASERPASPSAYGEQRFADDALTVLDEVGIERAAIVSVSLGASWGLILAATSGERVSAAVFIAPDLPLGPPHPAQALAYDTFDQPRVQYTGWSKWNRHYWIENWPGFLQFFFSKCFTEPNSAEEIEHFMGMGLETTPEVIIATVHGSSLTEAKAKRLASALACPTLVIHGARDEVTPIHCGEQLARIAGAESAFLPKSGHEPQCRSPAEVNRLLDQFLARHWGVG